MKKIYKFLMVLCVLSVFTCSVYAGSHQWTYNMTGGIFYKHGFKKGKNLTIDVYPTQGTSDCKMGIYTAEKSFWFGWQGADFISNVSSVQSSETKYKTKSAIDGIYFRDWAGQRWKGSFYIAW